MADAFLPVARYILDDSLKEMRLAVDGAPGAVLDRRPAGADSNSIAVLVTHALGSTRSWLSVAVGAPLPERDRESEFLATSGDTAALVGFFDEMAADCKRLLDGVQEVDWSVSRKTHVRPGERPEEVPAAFALVHAIAHLREHVGHVQLTRQLSEEPGAGG